MLALQHQSKKSAEGKPGRDAPAREREAATADNPAWRLLALRPNAIQTKLKVGRAGDAHEREADRIAELVTAAPAPSSGGLRVTPAARALAQRKCADCEDEEQDLRRKELPTGAQGVDDAPPSVAEALSAPGQTLDAETRAFFEPRFGRDLGGVRVHADAQAGRSAETLKARAYTVGRDIVFGAREYAPDSAEGRRLLAHELTHVVQQSSGGPPLVQRQPKEEEKEPPKMTLSGDAERKSKPGGVAIRNGALEWELKFRGKDNEVKAGGDDADFTMFLGADVDFSASFTPTAGATTCPTITFAQTVQPTIGGLWDTGPLLYTRSAATNASMDVIHQPTRPETEPFYSAAPKSPGPGLGAERTRSVAGTAAGSSTKATMDDSPFQRHVPKGVTAVRRFESAVMCVETAETFGSISWGYTKTGDGVVTLLGGTDKDVRASGASAEFETTRQAFYTGFFVLSLGSFTVGSAALTASHKSALDALDINDLTRVILVGANDNSGGAEAKADLSLKRAEAARDHLVKTRGVSNSLIKVEGHGVEARVPNAPGKQEPANRRVDVHVQRGAETTKPPLARTGSPGEQKRLQKQNPRRTVDEAVETILRLDATTGRVPMADWSSLLDMLNALDDWRSRDPTVPDLRQIYKAAISRIQTRATVITGPTRAPMPDIGPISPEVDEALRKYEEAKRKLEETKRERDREMRRLDELKRELEED
jgi:outer membrane protein OmpA-like peptidoglycan-associated protein